MNAITGAVSGMRAFAPRIASIGVSEILKIGAAAARRKRDGRPIIVLGAGEPDFDTPDNVKEAASRAIARGETKYTALDGTPELKRAIVEKFRRDNGLKFEPSEITAGAGAKQVIFNAMMATLDAGDEVILPAPYWTSYADIVTIADGVPVPVAGDPKNGFAISAADLERAITYHTRWLFLNSPSNPTGAIYSESQLRPLLDVLARYPRMWLLTDDIYEHLVYDGLTAPTALQLAPDLRDRVLTVNGVSKAYAMTGWRVGFGAGPSDLIAAMAVVQSQSTSNPCSIAQAAAIEALTGPQDILVERRMAFQRRRDALVARLNTIPGLSCATPRGAFYAYVDCAGVLGRTTPGGEILEDDRGFCRYLLEDHDLAVVPGSCFGLGPFFRVSYAASDIELETACARIAKACEALR